MENLKWLIKFKLRNRTDRFLREVKLLEYKYDPRARKAVRAFGDLAEPLRPYLNGDFEGYKTPQILQVTGVEGEEYTSVRRLDGDQLANFTKVSEIRAAGRNYSRLSLFLPPNLTLDEDQIGVMISPLSLQTDLATYKKLYHEMYTKAGDMPVLTEVLKPEDLETLPEDFVKGFMYGHSLRLLEEVIQKAPHLYNPADWKPGFGDVNLLGRFSDPLFGSKFYNCDLSILSGPVERGIRHPRVSHGQLEVFRYDILAPIPNLSITQDSIQRFARFYILQRGSNDQQRARKVSEQGKLTTITFGTIK